MTKEQYAEYLESEDWRAFSSQIREEAGACEECGITDTLNVHHKHYRSLGRELRQDVRVLCERCHHNTHILQDRMKMFHIEPHHISGTSFLEKRNAVQKIIEKARVHDLFAEVKKAK